MQSPPLTPFPPLPHILIRSLLAELKDALVVKLDRLGDNRERGHAGMSEEERKELEKLLTPLRDSVSGLLDTSFAPESETWFWPLEALDSIRSFIDRVTKSSWTGDYRTDWAEVVILKEWFDRIIKQVRMGELQREEILHSSGEAALVEFARETIEGLLLRCENLPTNDRNHIRSSLLIAPLTNAHEQLTLIQAHSVISTAEEKLVHSIVRNANSLALILVGWIPQIKDTDRPRQLATELMADSNSLRRELGIRLPSGSPKEPIKVETDREIGRRAAKRYKVERGAWTRETVWSRMV